MGGAPFPEARVVLSLARVDWLVQKNTAAKEHLMEMWGQGLSLARSLCLSFLCELTGHLTDPQSPSSHSQLAVSRWTPPFILKSLERTTLGPDQAWKMQKGLWTKEQRPRWHLAQN